MTKIARWLSVCGFLFLFSCAEGPTPVPRSVSTYSIVAPREGPGLKAAQILRETIECMGGASLPIVSSPTSPAIVIRTTPGAVKHDGFHLMRNGDDIVIEAGEPRGSIYGAYALLERLGCRFYGPAPLGVIIPKSAIIRFPEKLDILRAPDFPNRFPSSGSIEEVSQWGFNRCSTTEDPARLAEIENLGLTTFGFGHYWPNILDNVYFADGHKPEKADFSGKENWLPADKSGNRRRTGKSLCFSNPDALDWFATNAANFIAVNDKHAGYFNLWSADESVIELCRCEKCSSAGLNDTDWYLVTHNAIRKKLSDLGWNNIFGWIAYHGSETPPAKMGLLDHGEKMDFLYAPRPRGGTFFGPSTNDHPTSVKYRENLSQWKKYLDAQQYRGTRTVFEYYFDLVLLGQTAVGRAFLIPKLDVMKEDIRYYRDQGFDGFFDCNPPHGAWFPDPLHRRIYARLLWDTGLDIEAESADFFANYYRKLAPTVREVREGVEAAMFAPPSDDALKRLKELVPRLDALKADDPILRDRLKSFGLWVRYCALCKETEFYEKVSKDDAKVKANEQLIKKFFAENREFFLQNHIFTAEDFGMFDYVTKKYHKGG